jgi:hypothetical protein
MRIKAIVATVASVPSILSAAPSPIHLEPTSPWVVDYAQDSCRLARRFGDGKDLTTLAFESEAPGFIDMLVIGRPLSSTEDELHARFLPVDSEDMQGRVGRTTDGKGTPSVLVNRVRLLPAATLAADEKKTAAWKAHPEIRPPAESLPEQAERRAERTAFLRSATAVEIDSRRNHPVILDTGSLAEPFKAFDQCSRDSLRDWGIDPDLDEKIVRGPWAPAAARWFSPGDYPRDMLVRLKESVVKVRLLVDATGRVTKCTSLSHFEEPDFNKITCANFMKRAHFEPAELADGTKVPSYYVNNVVFRLAR